MTERTPSWRFDQVGDPAEVEDALRTSVAGRDDKMLHTLVDAATELIRPDSQGVHVMLHRGTNEAGRGYTQILVEEIPLLLPRSAASRHTILQEEGGPRQ